MSITAIILTFNEEQHIQRCIDSLKPCVERICVIDSGSSDATIEIARRLGAEIYENPWVSYAAQFQWALDTCDIDTPWTLRIDADERLSLALQSEMTDRLPTLAPETTGVHAPRLTVFMGQPIRHGFFYPSPMLRLWRTGVGRIENQWMDEHIVLDHGKTVHFKGDLIDENLNDIGWWTEKHNRYADREARDQLLRRSGAGGGEAARLRGGAAVKRFLKLRVYERLPATFRPFAYVFARYVFGLGVLDGKEGFYFHVLQGFWYRTLVEAKVLELKKNASADPGAAARPLPAHKTPSAE
ncbi:MAG: glycosyltransferase family 2 protein [Pseudomonadota bacterium]